MSTMYSCTKSCCLLFSRSSGVVFDGSGVGSRGFGMVFCGALVVLTHFSALLFGLDLDFLFELGAVIFMAEIIRGKKGGDR